MEWGWNRLRRLRKARCCGGEVKCQRSHEWDIESISFMFNAHMNEESNWRCGVNLGESLSTGDWKKNHEKIGSVYVCLLCVCIHAWVKVYGFICPLLQLYPASPYAAHWPQFLHFLFFHYDSSVFLGIHQWKGSVCLLFCCFSPSSAMASFILLPPWWRSNGSLRVLVATALTNECIWNELWGQGQSDRCGLSILIPQHPPHPLLILYVDAHVQTFIPSRQASTLILTSSAKPWITPPMLFLHPMPTFD